MLAAHYRRVSTGEQMDSLEDQEKRCLLYCSPFNQLEVPPELSFPDPAVSRTTPLRDRKGGGALMNRLALGGVHHLTREEELRDLYSPDYPATTDEE